MNAETYHDVGPGILTCDTSRCRMWVDHPRRQGETITVTRTHLDCVDCHATVHLADFLNGTCARDGL